MGQSDELAVKSLLFTTEGVEGKKKITKQHHKTFVRALHILDEITAFSGKANQNERPIALGGDMEGTWGHGCVDG